MSIHLIGGGFPSQGEPEVYAGFLAEAAARAAGSGRMVPRIAVLMVTEGEPTERVAEFAAALEAVAPCQAALATVPEGGVFASSALSDVDGLLIGGGLTPAYHVAVSPLADEIRLLVADGLPYLGISAGAQIAADRAIIGGWLLDGVQVCPEDTAEDLEEVTVVDGLALVDLAVDVHAAQWGTLGRLVAATEAGLVEGGVAIDENTGLVVGEALVVVGTGNVWQVVDGPDGVVVGTLGS